MSLLKKCSTLAIVLLSMTLFVACGEKKEEEGTKKETKTVALTPEATIKNTAVSFFDAMKEGDVDKMASFMSKSAKAEFEQAFNSGNAEQDKMAREMVVGMMQEMLKEATVSFGKVTINGEKATIESTAKMAGKDEETDELEFVKEDGKWVVAKM